MQRRTEWDAFQLYSADASSRRENNSSFHNNNSSFHGKIMDGQTSSKYNEVYERMKENGRIMKRIINPKRDKIILRSIQSVKNRVKLPSGHQPRAKTEHHSRRRCFPIEKQTDKSNLVAFNQEKYELKLENQRMGRRIINVKSMVRNLMTADIVNRPKASLHLKVNKGVKAFFRPRSEAQETTQEIKQNLAVLNLKEYYGYGPTILSLDNININVNPQLKQSDLVYLELIVRNSNSKLYRTSLVPYSILKQTSIKFALRLKRIGEFVPLKIWKVNGVQNVQIGIVDIHFLRYLHQQQQSQSNENGSEDPFRKVEINSEGKERIIVRDKVECKFRKSKKEETQGTVLIQYSIYRKRYS